MTTYVGVIGSGSFGTTIANLLAKNQQVLLYTRREEEAEEINAQHTVKGFSLSRKIRATSSVEELASTCQLIFPIVPSENFSNMIGSFGPFLKPSHILIHGTKGLDIIGSDGGSIEGEHISRSQIRTMSEVMLQETAVVRIGCLSGPNLAKEIRDGQPTATVIASEFDEVISLGQQALSSERFFVFGSHELIGAELAGALKNVIALGSGMLRGRGLGKNLQAMLITRGLREIIQIGKSMGSAPSAFLGTAGIGDLIATATSKDSRNYRFGYLMGKGHDKEEAMQKMDEVVEGIRTLKIAVLLGRYYDVHIPITNLLYRVVYERFDIQQAIDQLMRYPFAPDVDYL